LSILGFLVLWVVTLPATPSNWREPLTTTKWSREELWDVDLLDPYEELHGHQPEAP
jgi:hypothetical protein